MGKAEPGKILTFYSYKGGTGRSMMLANVAWILASTGKRVLVIDWDLEAPGVHRYFRPFLVDPDLTASDGVIDWVLDFIVEAATPGQPGDELPSDWYRPHADLLRYAASLDWDFPEGGTIDFVPAGRQGASYSTRVNSFNWQEFYERFGGGAFLEAAREAMRAEYDYILVDSRTGVSDTAGICTVQLPDTLVICFTLNNQSIEGASAIASSVHRRQNPSGPTIFPVPMRVEYSEKLKLQARREYAYQKFDMFPLHLSSSKRRQYWADVEVPYIAFYAYEEVLATFGDKPGEAHSVLGAAQNLTDYLTGGMATRPVHASETVRKDVLARYAGPALGRRPEGTEAVDRDVQADEAVFDRFTPEQQALARRALTRLVRVAVPEEGGDGTALRVGRAELDPAARSVIQTMIHAGLLVEDRAAGGWEETLGFADDRLIARWPRLQSWLEEDREFLVWRERLRLARLEWERSKREPTALAYGALRDDSERWLNERPDDLNAAEHSFIRDSLADRQDWKGAPPSAGARPRRARALMAAALIVTAIGSAAILFAWGPSISVPGIAGPATESTGTPTTSTLPVPSPVANINPTRMPQRFDPSVAAVAQRADWQSAPAATSWMLQSVGTPWSTDDVISFLGPQGISAEFGLLDATGAGLARALRGGFGERFSVENVADISFDQVSAFAGERPLIIGGRRWMHWTGVRGRTASGVILANPAPGHGGVGDTLDSDQFQRLGPFSGIWIVLEPLLEARPTCTQGYVWREAFSGDNVCVTPETREQARMDNATAKSRIEPGNQAFGPDTCKQGYVWREAGPSDRVCVTPATRQQAADDNRQAASRIQR